MKTGKELIADERARQISVEGWTPEHDDKHAHGELSKAADAYRIYAENQIKHGPLLPSCFIPKQWPWERRWWKPSEDPIRNLVKAGALYQAQGDYHARHGRDELVEVSQWCIQLTATAIDQLQEKKTPTP